MVIDMLSIDEAIAHVREVAEEKYNEGFLCHANPDDGKLDKCVKCAQEHEQLAEWLTQLKEYQQLEEQGRLVKIPCKVGDTIYAVGVLGFETVEEYRVIRVDYHGNLATNRSEFYTKALLVGEPMADIGFYDKEFGKTVFLTKSEAEAKLRELRCNNGK